MSETQIAGVAPTADPEGTIENNFGLEDNTPSPEILQAEEPPKERVFTQSEVNKIVGDQKAEARRIERDRIEADRQYQAAQAAKAAQASNISSTTSTSSSTITTSPEEIERIFVEMQKKAKADAYYEHMVSDVVQRVQKGIDKYSDFEDVVSKLNIAAAQPDLLNLLREIDNTEDVLHHFGKTPEGQEAYLMLLSTMDKAPRLAKEKLQRLSQSIKNNQLGSQMKTANEPLKQIQPSPTGLKDSGSNKNMSVPELKKQSYLRP
jgi:hypothetical protein